jgi:hypothetical protein
MLSSLLELLKPFYYAVQTLQQEDNVTSSLVYGQLKQLLYHASTFASNNDDVKTASEMLYVELSCRFDSLPEGRNRYSAVLLSLTNGCKPHYIIATLMDPSQAYLVDLDRNSMVSLLRNELNSQAVDVPIVSMPMNEGLFNSKNSVIPLFFRCPELSRVDEASTTQRNHSCRLERSSNYGHQQLFELCHARRKHSGSEVLEGSWIRGICKFLLHTST